MEAAANGQPARSTQWCVITGAPSSGKSAVVVELERRGHRVIHEVARDFITRELAKGRTLQDIKADPLDFERRILLQKIDIESRLPATERWYLDRATPDSIAYFRFEGLDSTEPERKSRLTRYHRIYFFDRLPFTTDPVRSENEERAATLERLLRISYQELGYDLVRVPVMPVAARTRLVLGCR